MLVDPKKLRRLYHEVAILPMLSACAKSSSTICCEFARFPAVCADPHCRPLEIEGTAILSEICFCAVIVAMDAEGNAVQPNYKSIDTTFAAIELSRVQTFWVKCQVIMISGTADTFGVCCIVVDTCGPPGWVGVDLDSWLPPTWQLPAGPALDTDPAAFTGGDCPDPVSHCQYISLVLSSIAKQMSVWVSDELVLMVFKPLKAWQDSSAGPTGSPGWSVTPGRFSSRRTPALHSLSMVAGSPKGEGPAGQDSWIPEGPIRMAEGPSELRVWSSKVQFSEDLALRSSSMVAGSPKGDGPAGQDSWLLVGPIRMAEGPSELRVWSSKVQFSEDPALKILSAVAWTRQGTGPARLQIKLPVTSMRRKHHQNWVRFAVDGSQRNQPQLNQCLW